MTEYNTTFNCPICESRGGFSKLFEFEGGPRQIIICKCGHQELYPFPTAEELSAIYNDGYYDFWGFKENFDEMFKIKLKSCNRLIKKIKKLLPRNNDSRHHLDIGCAFGYMLEAGRLAGFTSEGLEISPAAKVATEYGYKVSKKMLEDTSYPDNFFSLVTAIDVVEHIPSPRPWLTEAHRILKKGGVLMMETPDASSFHARGRGQNWPHYKLEHLHYFNPSSMKKLLKSLGFEDVKKITGRRYLTLDYIKKHYDKYQPNNIEAKLCRLMQLLIPDLIFKRPLPLPSAMVIIAKKA